MDEQKEVKNEVGIKDGIGADIEKEQRKTLNDEIKLFTKNIESAKKGKANFGEQWVVDKRIYEIILEKDNMQKLKPDFGYEYNEEYWDLRNKQLSYKFRMDKHMSEAKLKQYDITLETCEEQLEIAKKTLAKMDGGVQ